MSHIFQISDDLYAKLAAYAAQQKQTPEKLFLNWASQIAQQWEAASISNGKEYENKSTVSQPEQERHTNEHPLLEIAGIFAIGEPGWADRHDEYLAEAYADDHADQS